MKKRIAYIDLLKLLAIFMVITLHSGTWKTDFIGTEKLINLLQFSARLNCEPVPLFLLVNGFLIFNTKFDYKKHLHRIIKTVLIILCWSFLLDVALTLLEGNAITFYGVISSVLNTNINNPHTGVLWFLQKLVVVYLVFPILKHLYDTKYELFKYLLAVLIISTYSINLLSVLSAFIENKVYASFLFFLNQYSVVFTTNIYMIYFMVGGFLRHDLEKLPAKRFIILGILSAVVITGIGIGISVYQGATCRIDLNYSQIFLLFTLVGLFFLCSRIPMNCSFANKILASLGDNTMGIYLLHRIILTLIGMWLPINSLSFLLRILVSFGVLLICWGITVLIRRIPKLSFLVKL